MISDSHLLIHTHPTVESNRVSEKRGDTTQNMEPKTGMHIAEALRVQLDVQRRLHEQLEIRRSLQVRIEEQGRRLQKMFEDQLKAGGNSAPGSPDPDVVVLCPARKQEEAPVVITHDGELA